jgi:cytochrome c-type biogenesis protein CcmE
MAQQATNTTWEKTQNAEALQRLNRGGERLKFMIGGLLILAAIAYLIISGTATGARYFITVDELVNDPDYTGQTVRISGAVVGSTIEYDDTNLIIDFTMSHIPEQFDNLAETLHAAVTDPTMTKIVVHVEGEVLPDLLTHEAQAIVTGELGADGVFYASELLLKCPSRYEEAVPGQSISDPEV